MQKITLASQLSEIRGIGPRFFMKLKKLGIANVRDLLRHFPSRYEDWSEISSIAELNPGDSKTIKGVVQEINLKRTWQKRMFIVEALISDESGSIKAVWFNQPYIKNVLKKGVTANFAGKVTVSKGRFCLSNPAYEIQSRNSTETKHTARLVPIYPETKGLTSKGVRYFTELVLQNLERINEFLPEEILKENNLPEVNVAVLGIHFPRNIIEAENARKRFAFEELFLLQLKNFYRKIELAKEKAPSIHIKKEFVSKALSSLPFKLTESQEKSLEEILRDFSRNQPMNRLLQGDVGSGKTIVVGIAAIVAANDNYQVALMAPTEILARQHYKTLRKFFAGFEEGIGLLVSKEARTFYGDNLETSLKKSSFISEVAKNKIKIVIGTHALIQKAISFKNLGLVIIDEQHRFGVKQRAALIRNTNDTNTHEFNEYETEEKIIEKELSYRLNGLFFKVQNELGRFARERQYADALENELKVANISYKRELAIETAGRRSNFADFVIADKILIECKAIPHTGKDDYMQTMRYLQSANLKLGLLVNFRQEYLKPKRVLNSKFALFVSDSLNSHRYIPHFLSMSATPIPRTLMMTVFGDLDLSIINELPKGRKSIITKIVDPVNRDKAYAFIRGQVKRGRQVFVICPRIEIEDESFIKTVFQKLEIKSVKEEYEKLSKKVFPDLKVAMLHGKMPASSSTKRDFASGGKSKEEVMNNFVNGEIDVLISTSVVEVGVDVPNATIMMIEGAERFGLAQLYQFRGRVGRGEYQSFCFLFSESGTIPVRQRLESLLTAKNGFELAEKDLAIRGPGQFFGEEQAGIPDVAMKALKDSNLIKDTRAAAEKIIEKDPDLKNHQNLKLRLDQFKKEVHLE